MPRQNPKLERKNQTYKPASVLRLFIIITRIITIITIIIVAIILLLLILKLIIIIIGIIIILCISLFLDFVPRRTRLLRWAPLALLSLGVSGEACAHVLGFRVLGFRVYFLGFRVLGFRVYFLGFRF